MFSLTNQEFENLKSQFATSSLAWGGRRKLSRVFSDHGISIRELAEMASSLQSKRKYEEIEDECSGLPHGTEKFLYSWILRQSE